MTSPNLTFFSEENNVRILEIPPHYPWNDSETADVKIFIRSITLISEIFKGRMLK